MDKLTPSQAKVLQSIRSHTQAHGMPPTRAEIAKSLGFASPNGAQKHVRALVRKGAIEVTQNAARGIRPKESGLPLVGRVAAGAPILALENIMGHHPVEPALFSPKAHFLLKVEGASMRDAGILDGDWIAVHRTKQVESGQIAVVRLNDDVTVKRFKKRGSRVQLLPENKSFKPIEVDPHTHEFEIEGLVVGVIRTGKHI